MLRLAEAMRPFCGFSNFQLAVVSSSSHLLWHLDDLAVLAALAAAMDGWTL
jgi:hypothetical protein